MFVSTKRVKSACRRAVVPSSPWRRVSRAHTPFGSAARAATGAAWNVLVIVLTNDTQGVGSLLTCDLAPEVHVCCNARFGMAELIGDRPAR
jgi:hypothetical protein